MLTATLSIAAIACSLLIPVIFLYFLRFPLRTQAGLIALFLVGTSVELFDLLCLAQPEHIFFWKRWAMFSEALLPPVCCVFTLFYGRRNSWKTLHIFYKALVFFSLIFILAAVYYSASDFYFSPDFASEQILFLEFPAFIFYCGLLVFLVISLLNLETTLAHASRGDRWRIKLVIVGTGLLLAALVFYYSQGLLYRTINMKMIPVRSTALIVAMVLVTFSQLTRGPGTRIFISRNIAYRSVVLFFVGIYLIGLGLLGEGLKHFGDSFERSMLIAIAFLVGTGLLIVLLSESLKRRIRLFLHRHFYAEKYDYRMQWLDFTTRISRARTRDDLHLAILSAFYDIFGFGVTALFLKNYQRNIYSPIEQLGINETIKISFLDDDPLIQLISQKNITDLSSFDFTAFSHREFLKKNEIMVTASLRINEKTDGFILLGRPINRSEQYTEEDFDLMHVMSQQASSALLNFRLADQLAQARDMEAMGKVSAFVAHDIKNHVYTLSLMVDNAREYIADPEFQADMLDSLTGTIARMKILIAQLKTLPEKRTLQKSRVDLLDLAGEAADMLPGNSAITVTGPPAQARADREELHKVLLNLLLNALDAVDNNNGTVMVTTCTRDGQAGVKVSDTGPGIPEDFLRHNLFKPFQTTKKKGMGIGLYQCKQIVEAHGGRIEVKTKEGEGTEFTIWLPAGEKAGEEGQKG